MNPNEHVPSDPGYYPGLWTACVYGYCHHQALKKAGYRQSRIKVYQDPVASSHKVSQPGERVAWPPCTEVFSLITLSGRQREGELESPERGCHLGAGL